MKRDSKCSLALVIDCYDRGLIGWRLSKRGNARIAEAALKEAFVTGLLGYKPSAESIKLAA